MGHKRNRNGCDVMAEPSGNRGEVPVGCCFSEIGLALAAAAFLCDVGQIALPL